MKASVCHYPDNQKKVGWQGNNLQNSDKRAFRVSAWAVHWSQLLYIGGLPEGTGARASRPTVNTAADLGRSKHRPACCDNPKDEKRQKRKKNEEVRKEIKKNKTHFGKPSILTSKFTTTDSP